MPLEPAEAEALAPLESRAPEMLAQVQAWSAINSGSRNLDGLSRMADALADAFAPLGTVALLDPAPAEAVGADGVARPLAHGRNLHLSVRPEAKTRVLLTGHMDTVFAADHPFQAQRWLDDGRLNGPGVADMKGGIAVMLAALHALESSPYPKDLGYEVVINSDEEVTSLGSAPLLAEVARRCGMGLTYEPALPDGTLAGARKGSGNFSAVVRGRAAHAGREPEKGRNAVVAAADLALRLAVLARDGLSVNVAKIDGGGPNNIVPDLAVLRFNMRPASLEDQHAAEAALADALHGVKSLHEVAIELSGGFARPPKPLDANQRRLFDLVRDCGALVGQQIAWRDTGGVCDGNNIAALGLPVVDTMGVRGGSIHSDQEYIIPESLPERAKLSALVLMRLAQGRLAPAPSR
jgi:glutamate carboxypeptidase